MVLKGWRTEVVFVSTATPTTPLKPHPLDPPRMFLRSCGGQHTREPALNEPYLRQTNPIQLRVPDNIHHDAFMAVNFAFLRSHTRTRTCTTR